MYTILIVSTVIIIFFMGVLLRKAKKLKEDNDKIHKDEIKKKKAL